MKRSMIFILSLLMIGVIPVFAQMEMEDEFVLAGEEGFIPGPPEEDEFEALSLTDQQKDKFYELNYAFKKQQIKDKAQLKLATIDFHDMIYKDQDRKKIEKQIDKIVNLRMKLLKQRMLHEQDMREVLTPEQRKQLREMKMGHHQPGPLHGMNPEKMQMQKKHFMMKKMMPK